MERIARLLFELTTPDKRWRTLSFLLLVFLALGLYQQYLLKRAVSKLRTEVDQLNQRTERLLHLSLNLDRSGRMPEQKQTL
jgi:hypothetical protein